MGGNVLLKCMWIIIVVNVDFMVIWFLVVFDGFGDVLFDVWIED